MTASSEDVQAAIDALVSAYEQAERDGDADGMAAIQKLWDDAKSAPGSGRP